MATSHHKDMKKLLAFLRQKGFDDVFVECVKENNLDAKVILALTRSDLKDLIPDSFIIQKKTWDLIDDWKNKLDKAENKSDKSEHQEKDESPQEKELPSKRQRYQNQDKSLASTSSNTTDNGGEILVDFKFPIADAMKRCNQSGQYPEDDDRRQLIRDAASCLQAAVREGSLTQEHVVVAARKICDEIPVLKDPKPASLSLDAGATFPYWCTVMFLLKRRLSNIKSYRKRKEQKLTLRKTGKSSKEEGLEERDIEDINAELLKELKKKKKNKETVKELQCLTFAHRRNFIESVEQEDALGTIVDAFPFFKEDPNVLLNELELHCNHRKANAVTVAQFRKNWEHISCDLNLAFKNHEEVPQNMDSDDVCGAFLIHSNWLDTKIIRPLLKSIEEQHISDINKLIEKECKSKQPSLWCTVDEEQSCDQMFLVIDKHVFMELLNDSYVTSLLILMGSYFSFNFSYDKNQELALLMVEEFVLGIKPSKKSFSYRKFCSKVLN